jgi:WD40 repeat protein
VSDLAVSPDNSFIASASNDKTIRIWDMQGACVAVLAGANGPDFFFAFFNEIVSVYQLWVMVVITAFLSSSLFYSPLPFLQLK